MSLRATRELRDIPRARSIGMTSRTGSAVVLCAVFAATGCQHHHKHHHDQTTAQESPEPGTTEVTMAFSDLPQPVRDAFSREYPGAKITKVDKETYKDGRVRYEFEFVNKEGKTKDAEYTPQGERVEEE
jgi:ABC-type phosphate transport system substrate-binding protein